MSGPADPPRVTVLTTMKNEGAFLLEWFAHHIALGAAQMVICTNDCADGTDAMVDRLQEMGLCRHHRTRYAPGTSIQRMAFRQAARLPEVAGADWLYVCDADEFLVVHAGDGSFAALIATVGLDCEWISVPWRIFGSGGRLAYDPAPVTQQFTLAQAPAGRGQAGANFAKSLFRMGPNVARIGVHGPVAVEGRPIPRAAPGGASLPQDRRPAMARTDYRIAQVNHYALRAAESFLVKRDRGRVNHVGQDMALDYWRRFDLGDGPDYGIRRYDADAARHLATLLADARLAALHHAAVGWHRDRIAALKTQDGMRDLLSAITTTRS